MTPSLNEVEATAYKATRGAGRAWGFAEEAARAARWLARRGLPWERLAGLLEAGPPAVPALDGGALRPAGPGWLCPLQAGPLIADLGLGAVPLRLERLRLPLLLVPFVADLARRAGQAVAVAWPDGRFVCEPGGAVTMLAGSLGGSDGPVDVELRLGAPAEAVALPPTAPRRAPETGALALLERLVRRTYVPASEHSRRHGAGAGLIDAD
jgi:hypothetical protein